MAWPGGNSSWLLVNANVTGALLNLKNKAQSYALSGRFVRSTRQSPGTAENGFSTSWDLSKTSGNFQWGATYLLNSDHYNPNDLGFLFSANEIIALLARFGEPEQVSG